tara:strand:- start:173 stop:346 length:174 start_codon:yes stop_codon:yes gene_type:complete
MKCFEQKLCKDDVDYIGNSIYILGLKQKQANYKLKDMTCQQSKKFAKYFKEINGVLK